MVQVQAEKTEATLEQIQEQLAEETYNSIIHLQWGLTFVSLQHFYREVTSNEKEL